MIRLLLIPLALLIASCTIPMTTAEYREAAKKGSAFLTTETFEVNRPFSEVAQTFKKKAPECLNYAIGSTKRPLIGVGSSTHYYGKAKSTVIMSGNKVELRFQVKYENTVTKEPKDGMYYLVADARPVGKNRTRVDIYRQGKVKVLAEAIKGWASGENMGCPDPGQYL